jgi:hypothetical protein
MDADEQKIRDVAEKVYTEKHGDKPKKPPFNVYYPGLGLTKEDVDTVRSLSKFKTNLWMFILASIIPIASACWVVLADHFLLTQMAKSTDEMHATVTTDHDLIIKLSAANDVKQHP